MKNSKGFIVPLLILIIAALAIGGGVYVYTKNKAVVNSNEQQQNTSTSTIETSQTSTQISTINGWKTYTNSQYNFEFQYPSEVIITNLNQSGSLNLDINFPNLKNISGQDFHILVGPKPDQFTNLVSLVKNLVDVDNAQQGAMPSRTTYSQKTIGGLNGYLVVNQAADAPMNTQQIFFLEHNNYLIQFEYNYSGTILQQKPGDAQNQELEKEFEAKLDAYNKVQQIISTFSFGVPTSSGNIKNNWKAGDVTTCLPSDRHLNDVVDTILGTFNSQTGKYNVQVITIEQKLKTLGAICQNNKLVDRNGKEIYFYQLSTCWGNPPVDYQEIEAQEKTNIDNLSQRYDVIQMTCNPSGQPIS